MTRKMLTPTEAADYLGIKVSYLYKLMMRRAIPYFKPGGSSACRFRSLRRKNLCFFQIEDLDKWLTSVRVASDEELESRAQAYIIRNQTNH